MGKIIITKVKIKQILEIINWPIDKSLLISFIFSFNKNGNKLKIYK
jgi:hypothetical protein